MSSRETKAFQSVSVLDQPSLVAAALTAAAVAGFRRIVVTEPEHAYVAAWWPPGHGLGYEHAFTHQAVDLITAIAEHSQPVPSFADGLVVQRVLAAVEQSAANDSTWTPVLEES